MDETADGRDPWATNLPYILLVALGTTVNYSEAIALAAVWLSDFLGAIVILGIVVTLSASLLGYDREPLHRALFGR